MTDNLRIQGDYNSQKARSLVIVFDKCNEPQGSPIKCKSDTEIKSWLRRKFILLVYNQRRFRLEKFDSFKVVPESRTAWVPINSQLREEFVFNVQMTHLQLQDHIWQWSNWTKEDIDNVFKVNEDQKRPYEIDDDVQIQVAFEFNLDLIVIDRQVYSFLDWLGDIGGLGEACFFIGGAMVMIFNKDQFNSLLVSAMFRVKNTNGEVVEIENLDESDRQSQTEKYRKATTFIKATQFKDVGKGQQIAKISSTRLLLQLCFPKFLCLKKTRNDKLYQKGKKRLTKELDVVEFLKLTRECKAFIKTFVSQEDRLKYIKPARIQYVSSDNGGISIDEKITAN